MSPTEAELPGTSCVNSADEPWAEVLLGGGEKRGQGGWILWARPAVRATSLDKNHSKQAWSSSDPECRGSCLVLYQLRDLGATSSALPAQG